MRGVSILRAFGLALALQGCGMPAMPPPIEDPTPLSKCLPARSSDSPLVTEWPASEKAHIESLLAHQAVVVRYADCELRILEGCRPAGRYLFQRTSLATDTVEITEVNDLYAKLPVGAASLEAELAASGRLAIHTTAIGQMRLDEDVNVPRTAICEGATHVVRAMSVGAYEMSSGQAVGVGAGASLGPVGAGARHRSTHRTLRAGGDPARCGETGDAPHVDCRSPLQLFLGPVSWATIPAVTAAAPSTAAPPTAALPLPAPPDTGAPAKPNALLAPNTSPEALGGLRLRPPGGSTEGSSKPCEDVVVEVVRVTPVRPSFHLPRGGSQVLLKLRNRSNAVLGLPDSSGLHISNAAGDGFTAILIPEGQLWFQRRRLPAESTLGLEVIVGPGLTKEGLASVRIARVTSGSPWTQCHIRAEFGQPGE